VTGVSIVLPNCKRLRDATTWTQKLKKTRSKKGWEGQPKGLLQVLWERGWIDKGQLEKYTMDPATDDDGEVLEGAEDWSLKCLMASCLDFAQEMTALQHVGSKLGVSVIIMPKFHAELAVQLGHEEGSVPTETIEF
jgi:hypothetical protein